MLCRGVCLLCRGECICRGECMLCRGECTSTALCLPEGTTYSIVPNGESWSVVNKKTFPEFFTNHHSDDAFSLALISISSNLEGAQKLRSYTCVYISCSSNITFYTAYTHISPQVRIHKQSRQMSCKITLSIAWVKMSLSLQYST